MSTSTTSQYCQPNGLDLATVVCAGAHARCSTATRCECPSACPGTHRHQRTPLRTSQRSYHAAPRRPDAQPGPTTRVRSTAGAPGRPLREGPLATTKRTARAKRKSRAENSPALANEHASPSGVLVAWGFLLTPPPNDLSRPAHVTLLSWARTVPLLRRPGMSTSAMPKLSRRPPRTSLSCQPARPANASCIPV